MFTPARGHEELIDESVVIFVLIYTEVSRFSCVQQNGIDTAHMMLQSI